MPVRSLACARCVSVFFSSRDVSISERLNIQFDKQKHTNTNHLYNVHSRNPPIQRSHSTHEQKSAETSLTSIHIQFSCLSSWWKSPYKLPTGASERPFLSLSFMSFLLHLFKHFRALRWLRQRLARPLKTKLLVIVSHNGCKSMCYAKKKTTTTTTASMERNGTKGREKKMEEKSVDGKWSYGWNVFKRSKSRDKQKKNKERFNSNSSHSSRGRVTFKMGFRYSSM